MFAAELVGCNRYIVRPKAKLYLVVEAGGGVESAEDIMEAQ